MIPLHDDIPAQRRPIMVYTLITANVAIFLYTISLPPGSREAFMYLYGVSPARYTNPDWAQQVGFPGMGPLPFFSYMFLHGGLLHILGNMWMLWIFGDNVEDRMGTPRFIAFYVTSGLAALAAQFLFNFNGQLPLVGASGAVAGVMGAYLFLYPSSRVLTLIPIFIFPFFVELPAFFFLGFWFLLQWLNGVVSVGAPADMGGIAWWAHIGGFIWGFAMYRYFLHPKRGNPDNYVPFKIVRKDR